MLTPRGAAQPGETLTITAVVLSHAPLTANPVLYYAPMGSSGVAPLGIPLRPVTPGRQVRTTLLLLVGRQTEPAPASFTCWPGGGGECPKVYRGQVPAQGDDWEYFLTATTPETALRWPAGQNQTVIVSP